jgi:hypothetical protein
MMTFFVLLGIGAIILYRINTQVKKGYRYAGQAAVPLRTKVSVAFENFFERPQEFKASMPELYAIMRGLLNQDPSQLPEPKIP